MPLFGRRTERQVDVALLIVRLALGIIFIAHGGQKLFVYGLSGVSGSFGQMGIPMGHVVGPMVALLEFGAGIAVILGLLTRLAALGLAINMLGAIWFVHLENGFFLPRGFEFNLALIGLAFALVAAGAGRYSLDSMLSRRRHHEYLDSDLEHHDKSRIHVA